MTRQVQTGACQTTTGMFDYLLGGFVPAERFGLENSTVSFDSFRVSAPWAAHSEEVASLSLVFVVLSWLGIWCLEIGVSLEFRV